MPISANALPGVLLLQLGWIRGVEFNAESQHWIDERQAHLTVHWLLQIQPVFGMSGHLLVLQSEVVRLE